MLSCQYHMSNKFVTHRIIRSEVMIFQLSYFSSFVCLMWLYRRFLSVVLYRSRESWVCVSITVVHSKTLLAYYFIKGTMD